ncbi:MAG: hypothetical protein K9J79_00680 [Desulfobacteraceae bacterium]|nr:hypothetical protein [Desulfobacteraceae bacterium]MCF8093853.1 hypothetical protein [Desulfobacteraceae bacterium]
MAVWRSKSRRRVLPGPAKPCSRHFHVAAGVFLCCIMAVSGCASGKLARARTEFYRGDIQQAAQTLEDPDKVPKRSRLLYFMEKGLVEFEAGKYEQSINALRSATGLMPDQEVISVSRQGGSLITSERITDYKGEYAERLFVHTYLMMNYLLIRKYEDALVEAKQALEVINAYPDACRTDYFTRALIAHCFEVTGEANGAYIEYRKLAEDIPDPLPVAKPLYRLAVRLGFADEAEKYAGLLKEAGRSVPKGRPEAELIVFAAQGRGPVKIPKNIVLPPSIRFSFVGYQSKTRGFAGPVIKGNALYGQLSITTDVTELLKSSLNERASRIIAKESARVVAKESIASNIEDPAVEILVRIAFFLTEEPDTRAWETLPAYLTMLRTTLLPGKHRLEVECSGQGDIGLPEITVIHGDSRRYYHYAVRFDR